MPRVVTDRNTNPQRRPLRRITVHLSPSWVDSVHHHHPQAPGGSVGNINFYATTTHTIYFQSHSDPFQPPVECVVKKATKQFAEPRRGCSNPPTPHPPPLAKRSAAAVMVWAPLQNVFCCPILLATGTKRKRDQLQF